MELVSVLPRFAIGLFRFIEKAIDFCTFYAESRILIGLLLLVLFSYGMYRTSPNGKLFIIVDFIYKYFASSAPPKRGGLVALIRNSLIVIVYTSIHSVNSLSLSTCTMYIYTNDAAIGNLKSQWHKMMRNAQVENFVNVYQTQRNVNSI